MDVDSLQIRKRETMKRWQSSVLVLALVTLACALPAGPLAKALPPAHIPAPFYNYDLPTHVKAVEPTFHKMRIP